MGILRGLFTQPHVGSHWHVIRVLNDCNFLYRNTNSFLNEGFTVSVCM